ncbi:MAG TPA: hypothetical protein VK680_07610 [Solirubrobacteraceae bacterium]|jgi:hypothetical protein|nr:hypothetical protein [Solirubrobacteraceae bacterium]
MPLTLAIAIIVLADLALIGLLAFVMSRAELLTPHVPAAQTVAPQHRTVSERVGAGRARDNGTSSHACREAGRCGVARNTREVRRLLAQGTVGD